MVGSRDVGLPSIFKLCLGVEIILELDCRAVFRLLLILYFRVRSDEFLFSNLFVGTMLSCKAIDGLAFVLLIIAYRRLSLLWVHAGLKVIFSIN